MKYIKADALVALFDMKPEAIRRRLGYAIVDTVRPERVLPSGYRPSSMMTRLQSLKGS